MSSSWLRSTLLFLWALASPTQAQNIVYTPIPPGFDFPADQATLLDALCRKDEAALRTHGWNVFAGLTQPARPAEADSEAIWETWYRGEEVFSAAASPQGVRTLKRNLAKFAQRPEM